jgi:hypothetical protein
MKAKSMILIIVLILLCSYGKVTCQEPILVEIEYSRGRVFGGKDSSMIQIEGQISKYSYLFDNGEITNCTYKIITERMERNNFEEIQVIARDSLEIKAPFQDKVTDSKNLIKELNSIESRSTDYSVETIVYSLDSLLELKIDSIVELILVDGIVDSLDIKDFGYYKYFEFERDLNFNIEKLHSVGDISPEIIKGYYDEKDIREYIFCRLIKLCHESLGRIYRYSGVLRVKWRSLSDLESKVILKPFPYRSDSDIVWHLYENNVDHTHTMINLDIDRLLKDLLPYNFSDRIRIDEWSRDKERLTEMIVNELHKRIIIEQEKK